MTPVFRLGLSVLAATGIGVGMLLALAWLSDARFPEETRSLQRTPSDREARLSRALNREDMCQSREETAWEVINKSRPCSDTSQCVLVNLDCPFGCAAAVNAEQAFRVEAAVRDYYSPACGTCMYQCAPGRPSAQCIDSQCTVVYTSTELPELPRYNPDLRPNADLIIFE